MIRSIRLQNFRNYADELFDFSQHLNIIVGPNGAGKTNLLEAILMACTAKTYRAEPVETIRYKKPWARLDVFSDNEQRTLKLVRLDSLGATRSLSINNLPILRLTKNKNIPIVLFEPNHLLLFLLGPGTRREYIDTLIEKTQPAYAGVLKSYKRTLAQRNRLLKTQTPGYKDQIFVWNIRLCELGGQVAGARQKMVTEMNELITEKYRALAKTSAAVTLIYKTQFLLEQYSSQMLHQLEANLPKDLQSGFTTSGPHRDDLLAYIDGQLLQDSASRGEARTVVLALKMIELYLLGNAYQRPPLLLLDDVFSELDSTRRNALVHHTKTYQTFITTTDTDKISQNITKKCQIISLGD